MNIHEFEAKELLRKYGVKVPDFVVVTDVNQVDAALDKLKLDEAVIKIQVHAGGRGKAGGVKIAKGREEIRKQVKALLNMRMINNQTGSEGMVAHQVMISAPVGIRKEYYVGAIIDRLTAKALLVASPDGGMEIEEIAKHSPERILTLPIDEQGNMHKYHLLRFVKFMGWHGSQAEQGMKIASSLAKMFIETDASLLEINPLVETQQGELLALDAKLAVDDNALFRQEELRKFYDSTQVPKNEAMAKEYDLAYIALDGTIGCMVNGAGLAMATMDIIKFHGGAPANFLDVGGSATEDKVAAGFRIILSDPKVKAILVNIFGGIMSCETLAKGIMAAAEVLKINVPLVVRMEGTHVNEGKKILEESGLPIITASNLTEAAEKIVASASLS